MDKIASVSMASYGRNLLFRLFFFGFTTYTIRYESATDQMMGQEMEGSVIVEHLHE